MKIFRLRTLEAHIDLSDDSGINSIENKIPCLISQDVTIDDLHGYKCWAAGWGKTSQDSSGAYSNQVSFSERKSEN